MKLSRWLNTVLSVVAGGLIVLAFLMIAPDRSLASSQQAPPGPGIAISPGYSLNVDPDTVAHYMHVVTNTGTVSAYVSVQAAASEGWPLDYFNAQYPGGTTLIMPFPLQAGETTTVGLRLTVPDGTASGMVNTTTVTATVIYNSVPYTYTTVEDVAIVNMRRVYLPLVLREYDPLTNGSFSDGFASWLSSGTLGVSLTSDPANAGDPVALLGKPGYACWNGVPIGFAGISQSFLVPQAPDGRSIHIRFRYRIFTNDRNVGLTDTYDSFDVLINGVRRFRDANEDQFDECNVPPYDLLWRVGEIDLGAGGERVTLSFEVHNRADQFYNTYVYVDDVNLIFVDSLVAE